MSQAAIKTQISRDEIRVIYTEGAEAVIALTERLLERIKELETRIEGLENQLKKDSQNSSKPPSSDGFGKRTKSLRQKSERKSGGQQGHLGSTLEWSEEVDEVVVHQVTECEKCGTSLTDVTVEKWDLRQVHDLPPLKLVVSEHQAENKKCPCCGVMNRGNFPKDVNSTCAVWFRAERADGIFDGGSIITLRTSARTFERGIWLCSVRRDTIQRTRILL